MHIIFHGSMTLCDVQFYKYFKISFFSICKLKSGFCWEGHNLLSGFQTVFFSPYPKQKVHAFIIVLWKGAGHCFVGSSVILPLF